MNLLAKIGLINTEEETINEEYALIQSEYNKACKELNLAQMQFNSADNDAIDVAIKEVIAKEAKVNMLYLKMKEYE